MRDPDALAGLFSFAQLISICGLTLLNGYSNFNDPIFMKFGTSLHFCTTLLFTVKKLSPFEMFTCDFLCLSVIS